MTFSTAPTLRPRIEVGPQRALIDEPLHIRLEGLAPAQNATLRATLTGDPANGIWQSTATFVADAGGVVDVERLAPASGSYTGADGMGLLWSMLPPPDAAAERLFWPASLQPLAVTVVAEVDGQTVASATVERLLLADGVRGTDVRERGLAGRLFLPPGPGPHPAVIVVVGSGGGLPEAHAAFIASHGFAVLALAYFAFAGLPPVLANIPLEYFETAIAWLGEQAEVKPGAIGVLGVSRGGELVLLLGATFPAIRAVVALVPSHVLWGSVGVIGAPSWTYHGEPLPIMPPRAGSAAAAAQQSPDEQTAPIALTPGFLGALADEAAAARAAIPVERINGPVLLISGNDDAMWPSTLMAERVLARLREHGHPYRNEHLAYDQAGHTVAGLPFLPAAPLPTRHPVAGLVFSFGGTAPGVAAAQREAWPRILHFLHESLGEIGSGG